MNYEDLFKIRPVYDYDIINSKLAYIVREKKPIAIVEGEKIDVDGYADEVNWIDGNKLFITIDPSGGERRRILLWENGKILPILADSFDNYNPYPVKSGFLFLSNREDDTIHLYYLEDYNKIVKISKGKLPVSNFCVSPSNRYVVYSQGIYDNDLYISDINGNVHDKISFPNSEQYPSSDNCFINDDEFLFLSNHKDYLNLYKYNIKTREISSVIEENHEIYEAIAYNGITYIRDNEGDFEIVNNGKILVNEGYNRDLKSDSEYLYFLSSTYDHSSDVFRFKDSMEKLTDSMRDLGREKFVKPKKIKYDSEGIQINALLYEISSDKGVVYIHGGPDWECTNNFNPEIQLLVQNGFKVICPNYRGSTGYGRKFNHLNDKDLGGGDLKDVINSLKVLGVKKVVVTGASYGGYLTMMSVTKYPELWCCGVAVVPFVNWFTEKQFEREVLQQYDEIKMGNDEKLLKDRSPIFFIDRIKSPLLILAGENDPRCPAEETLQVAKELEKLGREVKYKIYKNEGHGFQQIENYVDSIKESVEFIKEHCK